MYLFRVGFFLFGLISVLAPAGSRAQDLRRLENVADSLAKEQSFSGAIIVAKGDKVLLRKAYGEANREWAIRNTSDTRFRLGSITKQFTAASILLLQERGKLRVTDSVGQYLPEIPDAWKAITVQQLLTHTSGIHSFTDLPAYKSIERFEKTPAEILGLVRDRPLDFMPGSRWNYSNSGYILLGLMIEKLSGTSYEKFVKENIFNPLGMKDSGYDNSWNIISQRAAGYSGIGNDLRNADFIHMSIPYAAGALYSTTGDLLRWQNSVYEGQLLSQASVRAMTNPVPPGYGFGLMIMNGSDGKRYFHAGAIEGFSTLSSYRPNEKINVIILSNVENGDLAWMELALAQIALGKQVILPSERKIISLPQARLDGLVGAYATPDGVRAWVKLDNNQLSVRVGGQPWLPIFAEADDFFFARSIDVQFEFSRSQNGMVEALTSYQFGEAKRMSRVTEARPDFVNVPFFLRGDMNNWGLNNVMHTKSPDLFIVDIDLEKGNYLFKFCSEDFKAIDFGGVSGDARIKLEHAKPLEAIGENLQFEVATSGQFRFTLDTNDMRVPKLTVTRIR